MGLLINLVSLNTGTHLDSRAIVAGALVVRNIIDILKVVGPNTERTSSSRLSIEIVTSVLDNESQASIASKVDSELDLSNTADIDSVAAVSTNSARGRGISSRQA